MYIAISISKLLKQIGLSEVQASVKAGITRKTWRSVVAGRLSVGLQTLDLVAKALNLEISVLGHPRSMNSELSTVGVSFGVLRDGTPTWKIHFMNFIDEFRRTLDPRLLILPPPESLDKRLRAMLASIALVLCEEAQIPPPSWAKKRIELNQPWFVSETESLKAMALLESPLAFRRNNIFVLENFMERI